MKHLTVLVDVDGVLADFISGALRVVYDVTGLEYQPHHVTEFDFCKALGLSREDGAAVKREIGKRAGFARSLFPFSGAREGIASLSAIADVYVVTSPWNSNATWMSEREAWLEHYFDIPHSRVIHASAKHLIWGDMFVDDKTEAVAAWERAWPAGIAVQWQTPHNRGDAWTGHSTGDWSRVVEIAHWLAACDTPSAPDADGRFDSGDAITALPVAARDTGAFQRHPDSPSASAGDATAANVARTFPDRRCLRCGCTVSGGHLSGSRCCCGGELVAAGKSVDPSLHRRRPGLETLDADSVKRPRKAEQSAPSSTVGRESGAETVGGELFSGRTFLDEETSELLPIERGLSELANKAGE